MCSASAANVVQNAKIIRRRSVRVRGVAALISECRVFEDDAERMEFSLVTAVNVTRGYCTAAWGYPAGGIAQRIMRSRPAEAGKKLEA